MAPLYALLLSSLLIVVAYGLARGLSIRMCRSGRAETFSKMRASQLQLTLTLLLLLGILALYFTYPLRNTFLDGSPSITLIDIAVVTASALIQGTVLFGCVYAVSLGFRPLFEALAEHQYTLPSRFRRRLWSATGAFCISASLVADFFHAGLVPVSSFWLLPIVLVLAAGYNRVLFERNPVSAERSRGLTSEERDRITRCYERFDRSPGEFVAFDGGTFPASAAIVGHGPFRLGWIETSLLESATDDELAVTLAHMEEKNRRYYWEYYFVYYTIFVVGMVITLSSLWVAPVLFLVGPPVVLLWTYGGAWMLRRLTYRADVFAATHLGPETVRSVYERLGTELRWSRRHGSMQRTEIEPRIDKRLDVLEKRFSLPPSDGERNPSVRLEANEESSPR